MTDIVKALDELWMSATISSETKRIINEALETRDDAVNKAINKIALQVHGYVHCDELHCPCVSICNSDKSCNETLAEWMKGIVEE